MKLEVDLKKLMSQEEIGWKQRSKARWIEGGDLNIAYFH